MNGFYGYGNLNSNYWFIGMEEGSDGTITDIVHRLQRWESRGKLLVEDVVQYHGESETNWFFGTNAHIQPTWNKLIRMQLSAERYIPHREMVRQFQREEFGRHVSNNCLLELLPLPSKSTLSWIYKEYSQIPELQNRKLYYEAWKARRAASIHNLVVQYQPHFVVFYSSNPLYQYWWRKIAPESLIWRSINSIQISRTSNTVFVITKHPVTQGISNEYFHTAGKIMAQERAELGE